MHPSMRFTVGLLLTGCAGCIDAIGFIELGGYFTSFMSGNTTQLGINASAGTGVVLPLALVFSFFLGSLMGSLIAFRGDPRFVLAFVTLASIATLALSLAGLPAMPGMLPLALGAGAQNAVLPFSGGARLGVTFVSGTLFAAGQDLAGALAGRSPPWRWVEHLAVWMALLMGALAGAAVHRSVGVFAILGPAVLYSALIVSLSLAYRRIRESQ
ncbi:MAG: YoaK family protein [Devosia sp.]